VHPEQQREAFTLTSPTRPAARNAARTPAIVGMRAVAAGPVLSFAPTHASGLAAASDLTPAPGFAAPFARASATQHNGIDAG